MADFWKFWKFGGTDFWYRFEPFCFFLLKVSFFSLCTVLFTYFSPYSYFVIKFFFRSFHSFHLPGWLILWLLDTMPSPVLLDGLWHKPGKKFVQVMVYWTVLFLGMVKLWQPPTRSQQMGIISLWISNLSKVSILSSWPCLGIGSASQTSGHLSVTGSISPLLTNAVHVEPSNSAVTTAIKPSSYYLKLFARVLKSHRTGYHLITDTEEQRVALTKPHHSAILWFSIENPDHVRDMYICFRLCGDDIALFVKHCRRVTHEQLNEGLDGTPPAELDYVPKFTWAWISSSEWLYKTSV